MHPHRTRMHPHRTHHPRSLASPRLLLSALRQVVSCSAAVMRFREAGRRRLTPLLPLLPLLLSLLPAPFFPQCCNLQALEAELHVSLEAGYPRVQITLWVEPRDGAAPGESARAAKAALEAKVDAIRGTAAAETLEWPLEGGTRVIVGAGALVQRFLTPTEFVRENTHAPPPAALFSIFSSPARPLSRPPPPSSGGPQQQRPPAAVGRLPFLRCSVFVPPPC
jgi:hypothetical protein